MRAARAVFVLVLFGSLSLRASERAVFVPAGGGSLDAACADPNSASCTAALEQLARRAADDLLIVAQTGKPQYRAVARDAARMPFPSLRAAGASALGHLSVGPEDTALLAGLLNDPVPVVRRSAHRALEVSSDPAARPLASRVRGSQPDGTRPQSVPSGDDLKAPVYAGAQYLYYASSRPDGQSEFSTGDAYEKVVAFYAGKYGPGVTLEDFQASSKESKKAAKESKGMPDMSSPEFQSQMQAAMDAQKAYQDAIKAGKSPQDAAQAMVNSMAKKAPANPSQISSALSRKEIYGSPRLFIVEKGLAPGAPARVVAVYKDLLLGKTGVAVFTGPLMGEAE